MMLNKLNFGSRLYFLTVVMAIFMIVIGVIGMRELCRNC